MKEVLTATGRVRFRYAVFITLALLVNIVDSTLIRSAVDPHRQLVLAIASSFDLVVVVPALYHSLLVRTRIRTKSSMIMLTLLATMRASFLFPNGAGMKTIMAAVCELAFIAILGIHIQQTRKGTREESADPMAVIRRAVAALLPLPVAINALTAELTILYYAFCSWGAKPHIPANAQPFTNHKRAGRADLLALLPIVCVFEIIPVHLLLQRWNSALSWIATALSAYALTWRMGLARSFRLRPTLVAHDYMYLRYGLIFQLQVPRPLIACVRGAEASDAQFAVPRNSEPTHCIEFVRELTAEGLFGFQRRLTRVALTFDDQLAFEQAVHQTFE
jgi:hypothetical protein